MESKDKEREINIRKIQRISALIYRSIEIIIILFIFFFISQEMRFIEVFIIPIAFAFLFYLLSYLVKRHNKESRLNKNLSNFYKCMALSLFRNIQSASSIDPIVIYVYYCVCWFLFFLAIGCLLMFVLMLYKSEEVITLKIEFFYFLIYVVLLLSLLLIPEGITIDESTNWRPEWSLSFSIYLVIIITIFSIIPLVFYSLKLISTMENDQLKKKWKLFRLGTLGVICCLYGAIFSNTLADENLRVIWAIFSLLLAPFLLLIYFGGRKLLIITNLK